MKRALASLVASAMLLFALAGCSNGNNPAENPAASPTSPPASSTQAAEPVTISVGVPTAPPALPVLHMMEAGLLGENVTIDLNVWNSPEELLAMVQGGEHDLYAFPLTVVSTLYNKGLDVRLMNVNTWGVTYFMTTDPAFETWADLAGKTVYIPLQSSPPDALTQYFLNEAGLTVGEDVEIVYASTAEVAALLASGYKDGMTLFDLMAVFPTLMEKPFAIRWTPHTLKFLLIGLAAYGCAATLYFSASENRRPGEEHGSARWGNVRQLNRKYRDKDPENNVILTQHLQMGLDGRKHRRNLLQIVIGGSGAGKTRFVIKPNIYLANTSYLCTDRYWA